MYITNDHYTHYRDGAQCASRGKFLILFDDPTVAAGSNNLVLRYAIRKVALRQCGHFMMGSTRVGPARIGLSGPFGGDGLPVHLDWSMPTREAAYALWLTLPELPADVASAYWSDDLATVRKWAHSLA